MVKLRLRWRNNKEQSQKAAILLNRQVQNRQASNLLGLRLWARGLLFPPSPLGWPPCQLLVSFPTTGNCWLLGAKHPRWSQGIHTRSKQVSWEPPADLLHNYQRKTSPIPGVRSVGISSMQGQMELNPLWAGEHEWLTNFRARCHFCSADVKMLPKHSSQGATNATIPFTLKNRSKALHLEADVLKGFQRLTTALYSLMWNF